MAALHFGRAQTPTGDTSFDRFFGDRADNAAQLCMPLSPPYIHFANHNDG